MHIDFQKDVLKFLVQRKDARKFIEVLESDLFDNDDHVTVFSLLKDFYSKYRGLPSQGNLMEHLNAILSTKKEVISKEVVQRLETAILKAYEPLNANVEHIKEKLIEKYQMKLLKEAFIENASKVKNNDPKVISDMYRKMAEIKKLGESEIDEAEQNRGIFLLKDYKEGDSPTLVFGHETYLKALNRMTAKRGFHTPQLVVLMAQPKAFKTGLLLNIAMGYVRDGYKVYYADAENGHLTIAERARQFMVKSTMFEMMSGENDELLTSIVKKYKVMGGEFKADFYPANTKTIGDIDMELEYLKDEFGWEPDIICYDYLDLFLPIDSTIKEKRLKIQAIYFDAIRLHNRRNLFGFSLSQVSKDAVNQKTIDMTKFAEDFGKAANCHAAFALCADPVEQAAKIARLIPVVQRQGVDQASNAACFLKIDKARMDVEEISYEQWKALYEEHDTGNKTHNNLTKKKVNIGLITNKKLKDE